MKSYPASTQRSLTGMVLLACATLCACGGGGGGATAPAATPPVAVTPAPSPTTPSQPATPETTAIAGTAYGNSGAQFADGKGSAARFYQIDGFVADKSGVIYVNDAGNCAIRKIAIDGTVSTLAGAGGQCAAMADGSGTQARFSQPRGLTADAAGNLYLGDGSLVRRITPDGQVSTLAGRMQTESQDDAFPRDGNGVDARFWKIQGIDFGPDGQLLVSDGAFNLANRDTSVCGVLSNRLRQVSLQGEVRTIAGTDFPCDGSSADSPLQLAADLRFDKDGNLYLFHGVAPARRTAAGVASQFLDENGRPFLHYGYNGNRDYRVAPDDAGNLFYLAENTVFKVAPDGTRTVALASAYPANAAAYVEKRAPVHIGNHVFLLSLDNQVVRVTLK